jgi:phosphatidylglycerol:prolipoprotein diacylglycerol transferase
MTTPYSVFWMLTALVVGGLLLHRSQKALGLRPHEKLGIALGLFCGAMIGAKLPFALSDWEALASGRAWFENGKTIVFGLVGGYLGVEIAKAFLGVTVKTGDSYAVPIAVAIGIGRLGCFCAGCCYGRPTSLPWGVDFGDGVARHPTQIYETIFHLSAAACLVVVARHGWFPRQRIKLYLIAYLLYRFVSETIRPEPRLGLGLTGYQWACLALIPVVGWLWVRDRPPVAVPQPSEPSAAS